MQTLSMKVFHNSNGIYNFELKVVQFSSVSPLLRRPTLIELTRSRILSSDNEIIDDDTIFVHDFVLEIVQQDLTIQTNFYYK